MRSVRETSVLEQLAPVRQKTGNNINVWDDEVVVWKGAWGVQVRVACRGVLECVRWASQIWAEVT